MSDDVHRDCGGGLAIHGDALLPARQTFSTTWSKLSSARRAESEVVVKTRRWLAEIVSGAQLVAGVILLFILWEDYFGEGSQFASAPWFSTTVFGKALGAGLYLAAAATVIGNHFSPRSALRFGGAAVNGGLFVFGLVVWWYLRANRPDSAEAWMAAALICGGSALQIGLLSTWPEGPVRITNAADR
jgi:hypothetical protein